MTWQVVLVEPHGLLPEEERQKAMHTADLYYKSFVGNLAGMCMKQKLTSGQHSASACCILPPM